MTLRHHRDREGGFTLIEILVAFAILAIGFLVLLEPMTGGLSRNVRDRHYEHAVVLAQSKLAELGNETPWFIGARTGEVDGRFAWQLNIKPRLDRLDAEEDATTWRLLDIAVEISWSSGFGRRSFALTTTRLVTAAALDS